MTLPESVLALLGAFYKLLLITSVSSPNQNEQNALSSMMHKQIRGSEHIPYGEEKDRILNSNVERYQSYADGPQRSSRGVELSQLLPFGPENGDSKLPIGDDRDCNVKVTLKHGPFVYFNSSYNQVWINNNGVLSFLQETISYTPICTALDAPLIMPFWQDVDTRNGGSVYYRQTTDSAVLNKVKIDLQTAFPNSRNLQLKYAVIATWHEVAFFGASDTKPDCPGKSLRNTLQVVLARDEIQSFVLLNYNKIQWTSGYHGGNACTGWGTGPQAKAGFDYGDGKTLVTVPTSCTKEMMKLAETSNFLQKGKWAFRVTEVVEDTCDIPKCIKGKDYYVNPYSCHTYYHCSNGVPILMGCPADLVFNPDINVCDWPASYPCKPICHHD